MWMLHLLVIIVLNKLVYAKEDLFHLSLHHLYHWEQNLIGDSIIAISEIQLAEEGQVAENGAGYTFFWRGGGTPKTTKPVISQVSVLPF